MNTYKRYTPLMAPRILPPNAAEVYSLQCLLAKEDTSLWGSLLLYAVSQSMNGRVINTCNLSEDWVGYSTRYGDSAGDVSLLGKLTVQEVKSLGRELGLPENLVDKAPSDGLCGSTDEQKLGFTYAVLDQYIREGICEDESVRQRIDSLHKQNKFKLELIPTFEPQTMMQ